MTEVDCLHVLEARSLRSRCWQDPLKVLGENLFQTSLLGPGSSLAYGSIIPISTWHSPCICVQISPFPASKDAGHIGIEAYPTAGLPRLN